MNKFFKGLVLYLALTLTMTACGGNAAPSAGAPSDTPPGNNNANTQDEKHLIIAVNPDYESFDPAITYEAYGQFALHPCYDNLFEFHDNMEQLQLCAATSYDISDDGTVYTFKMREDMVFASGNPVTATDLKWSVERTMAIKGNGAFMADGIVGIETPDDYTVIFTLDAPDPSFPTKLSYNVFSIIDSKLASENGATNAPDAAETDTAKVWFDNNSAGSGPYMIESYTPKVELILVRNPNYWGEAPYYDKVTYSTIADSSTQVMMLQRGDIDIAANLDAEQAKQLQNTDGITISDAQSLTMSFLLMNRDPDVGGPVADSKVQKAIRLALDYQGIQTIAGAGMTTPVAPFPVGLFGSLPARDVSSAQDVDAAKALMAEAGYADGFTVDFYVPTTFVNGVDFLTLAQKVQNDLAAIGINTNIIPEDIGISLTTYRDGKQPLGLWYWNPDYPDNNSQLAFLPGEKVGLRARWTAEMNPELAALSQEAAKESDPDKREALFEEIQTLMQEDTAFAMLLQHTSQYAAKSELKNVNYIDRYKFDIKNISE